MFTSERQMIIYVYLLYKIYLINSIKTLKK